jgi:hypothetical protein
VPEGGIGPVLIFEDRELEGGLCPDLIFEDLVLEDITMQLMPYLCTREA